MTSGLQQLAALAASQSLAPACDPFYFLRHGQTVRNAQRIFQAPDEPLSELGVQQAARAAGLLAAAPLRTLLSSDAVRALTTARIVAEPHGIAPLALEGLRERNFGALIGTSSAHIDWACEPEGGETLAAFIDRTRAALTHALAHPAPALIVAHGGTLYVLAALLGVPVNAELLGNALPLRFERHGGAWRAVALMQPADGAAAAAIA
jgi:probable phosphoglycerate mutase